MENTVLLLQSGGRDSAAAAVHLLEAGWHVVGITLYAKAREGIEAPRTRAQELSKRFDAYEWGMIDFTEWEKEFKRAVTSQLSAQLPKSCLICALSKITAVIPFCQKRKIRKIAVGYTEYQSTWAEQTPHAVELQRQYLRKLGIELMLPAQSYNSKASVQDTLIARELTPESLENSCCVAKWGTQPVPESLVSESIALGFEYFMNHNFDVQLVESIGMSDLAV
ncbi:MAG: hypothetical protein JKX76_03230 [Colwellia sp.]|nr:hypothetical protein [Colwellia sp.]